MAARIDPATGEHESFTCGTAIGSVQTGAGLAILLFGVCGLAIFCWRRFFSSSSGGSARASGSAAAASGGHTGAVNRSQYSHVPQVDEAQAASNETWEDWGEEPSSNGHVQLQPVSKNSTSTSSSRRDAAPAGAPPAAQPVSAFSSHGRSGSGGMQLSRDDSIGSNSNGSNGTGSAAAAGLMPLRGAVRRPSNETQPAAMRQPPPAHQMIKPVSQEEDDLFGGFGIAAKPVFRAAPAAQPSSRITALAASSSSPIRPGASSGWEEDDDLDLDS